MGKFVIEKHNGESIWRLYENEYGDIAGEEAYLTPYTEPDLEQEKKTAYYDGYNTGYQAGREDLNRVMSDREQIRKEAYAEGFKDGQYAERNGLVANYAQEQETIQVGDEVTLKCGVRPAIYMQGTKGSDEIYLLFNDGSCGLHSKSEIERKTGRHFHEIATILEKMRGETNE